MGFFHPLEKAPVATLDRSEVFQSKKQWDKLKQAPDIVLLGSSLMLAPTLQEEALLYNKPIKRMEHRQSKALSLSCKNQFAWEPDVFNFSVGGEMVSDAYFICRHILSYSKEKSPKLIVFGIAPRDFQDNLLPGIETTETYKILGQVNDLKDAFKTPGTNVPKKIALSIERLSNFYRYRQDLNAYLCLQMKKGLESILPWVMFEKYGSDGKLAYQRKGQFREEAIGTPQAYPGIELDHHNHDLTMQQYQYRYQPIQDRMLNSEFDFLERLLSLCENQGVKIILVHMPLSPENLALLPGDFYANYRQRIATIANKHNTAVYNLNNPIFQNNDLYIDSVHLKVKSSKRFIDELAKLATTNSQLIADTKELHYH